MPIYDYTRGTCREQFQVTHPMSQEKPDCPGCGGRPDRIYLRAPALHGAMARGREAAARTFETSGATRRHPPGCACCR